MEVVISKFNLDRQFTKEEREVFVNCVKNNGEIEANIGNAKTKSKTILEIPELSNIKLFCLNCLKLYSNNLDIPIK